MSGYRGGRRIGWIERALIVTLVLQIVLVIVLLSDIHLSVVLDSFRSFYQDIRQAAPR